MAVQITSSSFGAVRGRQTIVSTSAGVLYVLLVDETNFTLEMRKSTDGGATWSSPLDSSNEPSTGTTGTYRLATCAITSGNVIHCVFAYDYNDSKNSEFRRVTFTTSTDTWGTPATVQSATLTTQSTDWYVDAKFDTSDKLHVVYQSYDANMGTSYHTVWYTNDISGSWSTPLEVRGKSLSLDALAPVMDLVWNGSAYVPVIFLAQLSGTYAGRYIRGNGNNPSAFSTILGSTLSSPPTIDLIVVEREFALVSPTEYTLFVYLTSTTINIKTHNGASTWNGTTDFPATGDVSYNIPTATLGVISCAGHRGTGFISWEDATNKTSHTIYSRDIHGQVGGDGTDQSLRFVPHVVNQIGAEAAAHRISFYKQSRSHNINPVDNGTLLGCIPAVKYTGSATAPVPYYFDEVRTKELRNFTGFEITRTSRVGDWKDDAGTGVSTVGSGAQRSGDYCFKLVYDIGQASVRIGRGNNTTDLVGAVPNLGLFFAIKFSDTTPLSEYTFLGFGASSDIVLRLTTDGKIKIDINGVTQTSATAPFTDNTWAIVRVVVREHSSAGFVKVYIGDTLLVSLTGQDTLTSVVNEFRFYSHPTSASVETWLDDVAVWHGIATEAEMPDDLYVLSFRVTGTGFTTSGDALDSGAWTDTGDLDWSTLAQYTSKSGYALTDGTNSYGGPNGRSGIGTNDIALGGKYYAWLQRGSVGNTSNAWRIGDDDGNIHSATGLTVTTISSLSLTKVQHVVDIRKSNVPTKTDYARLGFAGDSSTLKAGELHYMGLFEKIASSGAITGISAASFTATGSMTGTGVMTGTAASTFGATAQLLGYAPLTGISGSVFGATANMLAIGTLTGQSDSIFGATATLIGSGILTGASNALFGATGQLLGYAPLSGTSNAVFDATAQLLAIGNLTGASNSVFNALANIDGYGVLTGASASVFGANAALDGYGVLTGASNALFSAVGQLLGYGAITGTSASTFNATGALIGVVLITGTSNAVFSATAAIIGYGVLTGTASSVFSASALIDGYGVLTGTSNAIFDATGTLDANSPLTGISNAVFSASANLDGYGILIGQAAAVFNSAGVLIGYAPLTGTSDAVFSAAGALLAIGALAGTGAAVFGSSANIDGYGVLTGQSPAIFNSIGTLDGYGVLTGTSDALFNATGALLAIGALAGASDALFSANANIDGYGILAGQSNSVFGATAQLIGYAPLTGISSAVFIATGILGALAEIDGQSNAVFSAAGQLTATVLLVGQSDAIFSANATISAFGILTGVSNSVFSVAGQLLGYAPLTGQSNASFAAAGILLGYGILSGVSASVFSATGLITGTASLTGTSNAIFMAVGDLSLGGLPQIENITSISVAVFGASAEVLGIYSPMLIELRDTAIGITARDRSYSIDIKDITN